jgi:outer membrane protein assembly factor BamB
MTRLERVDLLGEPGSLAAAAAAGPVYVVCGAKSQRLLHAVDLDGRLCWSRSLGTAGWQMRVAPDGGVWLADGGALVETTPAGTPGRRVEFSCAPDEQIGAYVVLPDGFLVAWTSRPYRNARLQRTDRSGTNRWSTELSDARLSYDGIVEMSAVNGRQEEPKPPWRPRHLDPERWAGLLVSADRVLATYTDHSSGIGMGFCLDLATGNLVWVTPPHPTGERAIAGQGRFLVGSQGYGAFSTWLYDRDGVVAAEWPSQGGLLVSSRGRIRVVELSNADSSASRIRRLHRDGSMTDGPYLPGYYTTGPVLSGDGRAAFWRDGTLQIVDPDLHVRTLCEGEGEGVDRMLLLEGGRLFFVLSRDLAKGDSTLVIAHTDLAPLDTGAWPCGEGGLHGNPVRAHKSSG